MTEFEITSPHMALPAVCITAGNVQKFRANFDTMLDCGVYLTSVTAAVTSALSTVQDITLADDRKSVFFFIAAGVLPEEFELTLAPVFSDGQALHYEGGFSVRVLP